MIRRSVSLGILLLGLCPAAVSAQVELSRAEPLVLVRGKENTLVLSGKNLQPPHRLLLPWKTPARPDPDAPQDDKKNQRAVFRVSVPASQPVGAYPLWLATGAGAGGPRLVWVDHLPVATEASGNHQPRSAQQLQWPVALSAQANAEQYDYFRIPLRGGQRVSFQVVAAALGSQADMVLKVFDPAGRELLYVDDTAGGGSDPQAVFVAPEDGQYLLQLHDVRFRGGNGYGYVLRVGRFPVVEGVYPLVVSGGKDQAVQVAGPGILWQRVFSLPSHAGWWPQEFRADGFPDAAPLWLRSSGIPEHREQGPNDRREQVSPLVFPCGVNGVFQEPGDRDLWAFRLQKGKPVVFQGQARQFGSPADLYLRVFDSQGKQLAEADDTRGEEGRLVFTPPADGIYYLQVEELAQQAGPAYSYRVEVKPRTSSVQLTAEALVLNAPQGGVAVVKVTATREAYNDAVELVVLGPSELALSGNQIPKGKKDTLLRIRVPEDWKPGSVYPIRLQGKLVGGKQSVPVLALAGWRKQFPGIKYPPQPLVEEVVLGIGPRFPKFFQASLATTETVAYRGTKAAQVKVTLKRLDKKFQDPVALQVQGLPSGAKVQGTTVPKGKNETVLSISVPPHVPVGAYRLQLTARGEFQYQPQQQQLPELVLHVKTQEGLPLVAPGQ